MSLSIGIVGLPNVGKSTLFNALLKRQVALAANYPFATIEPNVGVVEVPDFRLEKLAEIAHPEKIIYSTVKFIDIAGIVEGAHKGEGLGNKFLSQIRECDAIAIVVRNFSDENIIRSGSKNPKNDCEIIETELLLADLETLSKQRTEIKGVVAKEEEVRVSAVKKLKSEMENGTSAGKIELTDEEKVQAKNLNLLTAKPVLIILNSDEESLKNVGEIEGIKISAKIESELSSLTKEDAILFMQEYGISESGLDKVIKFGYELLGLQSFLTQGPKEVRAWTIKKGATARESAGVIHSDFEKAFIAADVVSFEDLVRIGSYVKAKEEGRVRLEGRDYVMKDGDVVEFRVNV